MTFLPLKSTTYDQLVDNIVGGLLKLCFSSGHDEDNWINLIGLLVNKILFCTLQINLFFKRSRIFPL